MSKPIGRKNKEWSKEEKYYYVQMVVNGKTSISQIPVLPAALRHVAVKNRYSMWISIK